jgi:hypothetical protein
VIALSLVADLWVDLLILGYGHLVCETRMAPQFLYRGVADAAQHLYKQTSLAKRNLKQGDSDFSIFQR